MDPGTPGESCITDEALVEFIEGRLSAEELPRLHRHAAECASCRKLLASAMHSLDDQDVARMAGRVTPDGSTYIPVEPVGARTTGARISAPWMPPDEFDGFRIERLLGQGAMGVVYLACEKPLNRFVAVKLIALHQPGPLALAFFENEARAIARLQHPNVVRVFRVGKVEGRPYIVYERIVGESLAEGRMPRPWREVLTLGLGIARGLAAAHAQGVLHRDIKPSNVLVAEGGEVKLLDFGLAESFDPSASAPPSGERTIAGTRRYMAPELFRGVPARPRSDIYSLGLVLYELCTGDVPRPRDPASTGGGEPETVPPLTEVKPGIDPDFAALIERCLSRDPGQRIASAEALCEALERIERTFASAPLAPSNPYRGLAPFEAEHQALFFGRGADIRNVLERLCHQPMVLVVGDSGVGKSSLCRAGVLPRVAHALGEGREFSFITICPGRRPLASLAAALAPILGMGEAEFARRLSGSRGWLGPALREAFRNERGLLLFVDQLEELVTLSDPAQATQFALLLAELALPSACVRVLLTVRHDFLTRVSVLPGLGEEVQQAFYLLRPMTAEGMREAIVAPARSQGAVFESTQLIQELVEAKGRGSGSLPLLQFTLAELWERRDPALRRITRRALEEMGGVAGALSRHADGVLARLAPAERRVARRMLLQLVTAEGTRIERGEEELVAESGGTERAALKALVTGRLLHVWTAGGAARYEIAHDSLIESWGTLRGWLDDGIGQRAVKQRVEAAAAEWQRLARAPEALWGQLQLEETRSLDASLLGPGERDFLLASRRAANRRRWRRRGAVLLLVLGVTTAYGLQAYLARSAVAAQLAALRPAFDRCRASSAQAKSRREKALAVFDGRASDGRWTVAERLWTEAREAWDQATTACTAAEQSLQSILERAGTNGDAKRLLREVAYERFLLAESFHPQGAGSEVVRLLQERFDDPEWQRRVSEPAELELVTTPAGARVEIERYVKQEGRLRLEPVPGLGPLGTPLTHLALPSGSYLLHVTLPERAPVQLPLLLSRGAREQVHLALPLRAEVPEGYVYVPPGCFLMGSDDGEMLRTGFLRASPLHRVCLDQGYLIGATEVTFGQWLEYLDSLPPDAPARHLLERRHVDDAGAMTLRWQAGAGWIFSFHRGDTQIFAARRGEKVHYPGRTERQAGDWLRFPLSGISPEELERTFIPWLERSGRLRGARLCDEREWERAARGADGRAYPHGDQLVGDDVNIDETYRRQPDAFGPDEVGSHPDSISPFGLYDTAGNANEVTRSVVPEFGPIVLRGGSWYYDRPSALLANRTASNPSQRGAAIGMRVCAPLSPR